MEENKIEQKITLYLFLQKGEEKEIIQNWDIEPNKKYTVGRSKGHVDLSVRGVEGISRNHAEIMFYSPEKIMVKDLGSRNGSYINKKLITPQEEEFFTVNDILSFGDLNTELVFHIENEPILEKNASKQQNAKLSDESLEKQKNQMTISKQEIREQQEDNKLYSYNEKFEDGMKQMHNQGQRQGNRFNNKFHRGIGFNKNKNFRVNNSRSSSKELSRSRDSSFSEKKSIQEPRKNSRLSSRSKKRFSPSSKSKKEQRIRKDSLSSSISRPGAGANSKRRVEQRVRKNSRSRSSRKRLGHNESSESGSRLKSRFRENQKSRSRRNSSGEYAKKSRSRNSHKSIHRSEERKRSSMAKDMRPSYDSRESHSSKRRRFFENKNNYPNSYEEKEGKEYDNDYKRKEREQRNQREKYSGSHSNSHDSRFFRYNQKIIDNQKSKDDKINSNSAYGLKRDENYREEQRQNIHRNILYKDYENNDEEFDDKENKRKRDSSLGQMNSKKVYDNNDLKGQEENFERGRSYNQFNKQNNNRSNSNQSNHNDNYINFNDIKILKCCLSGYITLQMGNQKKYIYFDKPNK